MKRMATDMDAAQSPAGTAGATGFQAFGKKAGRFSHGSEKAAAKGRTREDGVI